MYVFTLEAFVFFKLELRSIVSFVPKEVNPDGNFDLLFIEEDEEGYYFPRYRLMYRASSGSWIEVLAVRLIPRDDAEGAFRGYFVLRRANKKPQFVTYTGRVQIPKLVGPMSGLESTYCEVVSYKPIVLRVIP